MEDRFSTYQGWANGFRMIQAHYIYCVNFTSIIGGSKGEESACSAGDPSSIPRFGRAPGEGNGNPLQYSCLENPMDGGGWWATVHRVAKS